MGWSLIGVYFDKGLCCNYHEKGNVSEKGFVKMVVSHQVVCFLLLCFLFLSRGCAPLFTKRFSERHLFQKRVCEEGWSLISVVFHQRLLCVIINITVVVMFSDKVPALTQP